MSAPGSSTALEPTQYSLASNPAPAPAHKTACVLPNITLSVLLAHILPYFTCSELAVLSVVDRTHRLWFSTASPPLHSAQRVATAPAVLRSRMNRFWCELVLLTFSPYQIGLAYGERPSEFDAALGLPSTIVIDAVHKNWLSSYSALAHSIVLTLPRPNQSDDGKPKVASTTPTSSTAAAVQPLLATAQFSTYDYDWHKLYNRLVWWRQLPSSPSLTATDPQLERTFRVMVYGPERAGKSALTHRYVPSHASNSCWL
jgi:hypothetical protein